VRYYITHRTTYEYDSPVTVCHYLARLAPRNLPTQDCPWHELTIKPEPCERAGRTDYFGNTTVYFEINKSHHELEVISRSLIEVSASPTPVPEDSPPWETVRDACRADRLTPDTVAAEFVFASPLIKPSPQYAEYAAASFSRGKTILAGIIDLNRRMKKDFVFDSTATDSATPVSEAFKKRRGVCQDFAQIMIAGLRSIGIPARYVSGYLETLPPPGRPRLIGADASHAWVSVWCGPELGWMDADPTNNILPSHRHITVAWGRDFSDVSPLKGVTTGGSHQRLSVEVDVLPDGE